MIKSVDPIFSATDDKLSASYIPKLFWESNLGVWADDEVKGTLDRYTSKITGWVSKGLSVMVRGMPCSGKTSLAVYFAKEVVRRGGTACFVSASDLFSGNLPEGTTNLLYNVDLLILDNFNLDEGIYRVDKNLGSVSQYEKVICDLLRHRLENCKSVVLTTVHSKSDFKDRLTPINLALLKRMFKKNIITLRKDFNEECGW